MKVLFIRHGQSADREKVRHTRNNETVLSELGSRQANLVGQRVKHFKIAKIYTSPTVRARQTADIISQYINVPSVNWPELIEFDRFQETYQEVISRIDRLIDRIKVDQVEDKIICVSHATFIELVIARMIFQEILSEEIIAKIRLHFGTTNTGISIMELDKNENWHLLSFNDYGHLSLL
jgi:broad specificity phosphatase PhoE